MTICYALAYQDKCAFIPVNIIAEEKRQPDEQGDDEQVQVF
jgi:hypothetical protein